MARAPSPASLSLSCCGEPNFLDVVGVACDIRRPFSEPTVAIDRPHPFSQELTLGLLLGPETLVQVLQINHADALKDRQAFLEEGFSFS